MSAETLRKLDDALQEHLASENDGVVVTAWVAYVSAESLHDPSKSFYQSLVHESQPFHSTMGLVRMLACEYEYPPVEYGDDDD